MSEFGSPSQALRFLTGGHEWQDGPEAGRRQAEWERQIETLDQKEMELHQTQLKLIRQQTATFIQDLNILRQEVTGLKMRVESSQGVDSKVKEVKDLLDRHKQEHDSRHSNLQSKFAVLEREFPCHRDELAALHVQVRGWESTHGPHMKDLQTAVEREFEGHAAVQGRLERRCNELVDGLGKHAQLHQEMDRKLALHRTELDRKLDASHNDLKDGMAQHADNVSKMQRSVQQAGTQYDYHHGTLNERLDKLDKEIMSQVSAKLGALDADMQELRAFAGGEKQAREGSHGKLQEQHATTSERLNYLEKLLGDSSDKHAQELSRVHGSIAQHASVGERMNYLEKLLGDSADKHAKELKAAHDRMDQLHGRVQDHHAQFGRHAPIEERMNYLERLLGDSADKHAEALRAAHSKLEQMHGRLAQCEKQGASMDDFKKMHHATLKDRVDYLEKLLGDSADKHARELEALKAAHAKHEGAFSKHARDLDGLRAAHAHHATVGERLVFIEKLLGDSADKHADELAAAHAKLAQMHDRVSAVEVFGNSLSDLKKAHSGLSSDKKALDAHHASLKERVDYIEQLLGDSADKHDKHGRVMDTVSVKLEQIHGRLAACEKHGVALGELRQAHGTLANEKAALDAHHATVRERVDYLERVFGDSADKHAKEVQALKVAHAKHADDVKSLKQAHAHHATVWERLDYVERVLGDSADKHTQELDALRAAHAKHEGAVLKHAKDLEAVRAAHAHHATIGERLVYVEKLLGDSADKHAEELAAAHAKLDQVHGRLMQCEKHGVSLGDLKKAHSDLANNKALLDAHHATLKERVDYLENMLGSSADRHAREVEVLKAAHSKHAKEFEALKAAHAHHATIDERVNYLEKVLGDSADRHAQELDALKTAHAKHEGAFSKHAKELEGLRMAHAHHATVGERLSYVEKCIGDSADRHAEALKSLHDKFDQMHGRVSACERHGASLGDLKKAHSNLGSTLETHHATLKERVDFLENLAGDSADKHARLLEAANAKLESMHGRLSVCEKHGAMIGELKKSHSGLVDKAAFDAHHATMRERMDYVEKLLGDSADKHAKQVEALKVAQAKHEGAFAKHAKDLEGLKAATKHHASVGERLDYIEQTIGDSADKHAAELAAAHSKIEQLHGKFADERSARDGHLSTVKDLVARDKERQEAHHATLQERVVYLENVLGDNADKHARELEAHRTAHTKLASDHRSHEARHASMEERVAQLERAVGDSLGKQGLELKATQAKLDRLNGRLSHVKDAWGQDV